MTEALVLFAAALAGLWVFTRLRQLAAIDRAISDYRIALEFLAEERAEMPHEFAAVFLSGNRAAMRRKFADFFDFRDTRLAEIRNGEEDA